MEKLKRKLLSDRPVHEILETLNQVSEREVVKALLLCFNSGEKTLKEGALVGLEKLSQREIVLNFSELLLATALVEEKIRVKAFDLLKSLSSKDLVDQLDFLIDQGIRAQPFFIKFYSEKLIQQINGSDLVNRQEFIINQFKEEDVSKEVNLDLRRVLKNILIKMLKNLSFFDIYQRKHFLEELSEHRDVEIRDWARWLLLRLIEEEIKEDSYLKKILLSWEFISRCLESQNPETRQLAIRLRIISIRRFPRRRQWEYLSWLAEVSNDNDSSFSDCCDSQELALNILDEEASNDHLFTFRLFLFKCLDFKKTRKKARRMILKMPSYLWYDDFKGLLSLNLYGSKEIQEVSKKALLSLFYVPEDFLKDLLEAQRSIDPEHRKLTRQLALRVKIESKEVKEMISVKLGDRQKNIAELAAELV